MGDDKLPGWAYPTSGAQKLHYFPAQGEPSLCRHYFAGVISAFDFPKTFEPTEKRCCATCWRKAPVAALKGGDDE